MWTPNGSKWNPKWAGQGPGLLGPLAQAMSEDMDIGGLWGPFGVPFLDPVWGPFGVPFGAHFGTHLGVLMWGDVMSHITYC